MTAPTQDQKKGIAWDEHKFKCPICRRHVSIEGLIIREKQLCSKGRKLAKAAWSMAEANANMGIK